MKKIPTVFERDWNGDRSLVINKVTHGCEWVIAGEGIASPKLDGSCCLLRDGKLYKRRELRAEESAPQDFEEVERDAVTGKAVGWMPIADGPEDQWHREGLKNYRQMLKDAFEDPALEPTTNGTFELIGPKVQGGAEVGEGDEADMHMLIRHGTWDEMGFAGRVIDRLSAPQRTFEGMRDWFDGRRDMEGIVFHHRDGRMAKIKLRDFGFKRAKVRK